jgi:hypothetical protein
MYFYARWFDISLSSFAQADTIVPAGVQGLDRYAYVNNLPMNYTDPSGHICVEDDGGSDAGMAGNCNGGSNPNYKGGLRGSPNGYTRGENEGNEDPDEPVITNPVAPNGAIAVPAPQPPGSPPVPTTTTMAIAKSTKSNTITEEIVPDTQGFGWDPAFDPFFWNPFPINFNPSYDGIPLDDLTLDAVRETTVTTNVTINLVTVDQYDGVIQIDEYSYSDSYSFTEYYYAGSWNLTHPMQTDPWSRSVR